MIGKSLAHYQILEKIGAGGMGEVYRAQDTKLDRDVAIKFLPEAVARDPERLARFEREAKILAAVNHPGIATVFGLHEQDGTRFMAMELVPGADLSQIIAMRGLPLRDALDLAVQIAEALEAAHEQGIVHRDLKPSNIMVTPDGRAKVLDFGLARSAASQTSSDSLPMSQSPTMTSLETVDGAILGTAAYMSPEQARGYTADRRADIWAFGAVLYELLAGNRPFRGKTVSDTLAAVLKEEPDWSALPSGTPAAARRTLRRCLVKDRKQRLHHIADARLELLDGREEPAPETGPRMPTWAWGLIVVAAVAATLFAGSRFGSDDTAVPELPHRQFAISLPGLSENDWTRPVIAPDGKRLAYRLKDQLLIRNLDALEDREVAGGKGGNAPFWSPDGAWLAFARDAKLWKVPATGGPPVMLCDLPDRGKLMSGAWSNRDRIAISMWRDAIFELPAQGGAPQVLVEPDSTIGKDFQNILYLPDGATLLTTPHPQSKGTVKGTNMGKILAIRDGKAQVVLGDEESLHSHGIAWSPTGHLLYNRAFHHRGIWAVPFAPDRLEPTGEPFLVVANANVPSVAGDGTLAYRPDQPDTKWELVWVDRRGEVLDTVGKPAERLENPALSPDGTQVAYSAIPDSGTDPEIYILNLTGGAPIRLTFAKYTDDHPEWSPDGRLIIFEKSNMVTVKPADGTGEMRTLFRGTRPTITPDGRNVIYSDNEFGKKLFDVLIRPLDGSGEATVLLDGPAEEMGRLSPQEDYLAYQSNETGRDEIYLTRYPGREGRWQVSTNGGQKMRWGSDGGELIFGSTDGALMAVEIRRKPSLHIGEPMQLFDSERNEFVDPSRGFDVSPDGEHLLMIRRIPEEGDEPSIVVVQNWLAEI